MLLYRRRAPDSPHPQQTCGTHGAGSLMTIRAGSGRSPHGAGTRGPHPSKLSNRPSLRLPPTGSSYGPIAGPRSLALTLARIGRAHSEPCGTSGSHSPSHVAITLHSPLPLPTRWASSGRQASWTPGLTSCPEPSGLGGQDTEVPGLRLGTVKRVAAGARASLALRYLFAYLPIFAQ